MTHLLDTDTCIHILRGREATLRNVKLHSPADLAISAITRYELLYGVERCPPGWRRKESGKIALLLDHLRILPLTGETAPAHAAVLRADLESKGKSIGPMDVLIAATAIEHALEIVTHNLSEFLRISGLRCTSWSS